MENRQEPGAFDLLQELLNNQRLAVVATHQHGRPYTSLVAFSASRDCRRVYFVTGRATNKYRNLSHSPHVSLLIDSRTHSVEDFATGVAATVLGKASEVAGDEIEPVIEDFLARHPHLEAFVRSPSTAVCRVDVEKYYLVTRFQYVVEMDVARWPSSIPGRK